MTQNKGRARLLITGAGGQVGQERAGRGGKAGFDVLAFARDDLNIADGEAVARTIATSTPNIVINAAAYTAVDRAESEPEIAHAINAAGAGHIARACADAGIPVLHISTDYVFDGRGTDPYREDDPIAPQSVYGASKAAGEEGVRNAIAEHIILRTSWVFAAHGNNFVKTMLRLAKERDELAVVNDQQGCPSAASDIAEVLLTLAGRALRNRDTFPWSTYHFCNHGVTSWYGFASAIVREAARRGGRSIPVRGIPTREYPTPARRPAWSVLDCSKLEQAFGITPRPWEEALGGVLDVLIGPADSTQEQ
ncbi:MAG: dTDP-4-dehydrorhamnose reductase [Alphaproteobacteria bacterium]|nr:dTDP-4-dehydrorhamnose reductase [Alphaproteobacteria bacterium]MDX5492852.1 dTDP-4-dehydrorhamnose reductase [Alphaproteobacteria bacterium]